MKLDLEIKEDTKPDESFTTVVGLDFLEYLGEGVIVLDSERKILMVNSALETLLGWKSAELVGRHCLDYLCCQHPDTGTFLCQNLCPLLFLHMAKYQDSPPVHYQELYVKSKSGQLVEVSASIAPLAMSWLTQRAGLNGPNLENAAGPANTNQALPPYSILLLRDITEVKRQDRIKVEFIAAASHQLRTPLTSIKTATGLLQEHVGDEFSRPLRRLLDNIQSSSARLERLVNDLIELTNIQSGRVKLLRQLFEARELVSRAIENSRERLQGKNQLVEWIFPDELLFVRADFGRMGQVLSHLISNASKFSPAGSTIELEVRTATNRNDGAEEVVFSVCDQGIGIADTEKILIFENFYQSQISENTIEPGVGMGLSLAKALVELNGGRLWFQSELGKGSSFYFSLPLVNPGEKD